MQTDGTGVKRDPVTATALEHTNGSTPNNNRFDNSINHRYLLRSKIKHHLSHIFQSDGRKETIDSLLASKDKVTWTISLSNEWGRLANGNERVTGTNTIKFISKTEVPKGCDVIYDTYVCDHKPLKTEKHRVRITVGSVQTTQGHQLRTY